LLMLWLWDLVFRVVRELEKGFVMAKGLVSQKLKVTGLEIEKLKAKMRVMGLGWVKEKTL